MRVLMFGWEFPPFKSGGLGTACQGMATALAKKGTEIFFVLPRAESDPTRRRIGFAVEDGSVSRDHPACGQGLRCCQRAGDG